MSNTLREIAARIEADYKMLGEIAEAFIGATRREAAILRAAADVVEAARALLDVGDLESAGREVESMEAALAALDAVEKSDAP